MKKFTKLFLSCAAIAALTVALGTAAFAAEHTVTGTDFTASNYEDTTGTLTISVPAKGAQQTIIVAEAQDDITKVKTTDILGIDQDATITTVKLDTTKVDPATKTYYVFVGGSDGTISVGHFGAEPAAEGETFVIGNVDSIPVINANDATCILRYGNREREEARVGNTGKTVKLSDGSGNKLIGDVDSIPVINANDATCILRYGNREREEARVGNVGKEIKGTIVTAE